MKLENLERREPNNILALFCASCSFLYNLEVMEETPVLIHPVQPLAMALVVVAGDDAAAASVSE